MGKRSGFKMLAANTAIFAIVNFASKIINFLLVPLYTNILTTREYGTIEIIINAVSLVVPVLSLSISEAVLRFGIENNSNSKDILKNASLINILGSLTCICFYYFFQKYLGIAEWTWYFIAMCIIQIFRNTLSIYLKSIDKTKLFAVDAIICTALTAGLNVFFLCILNMGIQGYLLGYIAAQSFSIIFLLFRCKVIRDLIEGKISITLILAMLRYSVPLIIGSLAWWIITFSDRFMIGIFMDEDNVGIYSVAAKIPGLLSTIMSIFIQAWNLSAVVEYDSGTDIRFYSKTFSAYMVVLYVVSWGVISFVKPFMKLYVGAEFYEAWRYVPLLLLATVFLMIAWFVGPIYNAAKKSVAATCTVFASAVINICANYVLIQKLGVQGAVLGTLFAYASLGIIRLIDTRRYMKFDLHPLKLSVSLIALCILAFCSAYEINSLFVAIVIAVIIIIVNYKELAEVFRQIKRIIESKVK